MIILRPKRWTEKPHIGTQINWGHPLAERMETHYALNQRERIIDMTGNGHSGAISTESTPSILWVTTRFGLGVKSELGTGNKRITIRANEDFVPVVTGAGDAWTVRTRFIYRDHDAGSGLLFGQDQTGGHFLYQGKIIAVSFSPNIAGTTELVVGRLYDWITTRTAAGVMTLYLDAKIDASGTTATGAQTWNGMLNDTASETVAVELDQATIWPNRVLTANEVAWLYAEPYAFLLPQSPRIRVFLPSGVVAYNPATSGWSAVAEQTAVTGMTGRWDV